MIHFEIKKEDRLYALSLPAGAPYGEVYDVLYQMLTDVAKMAVEAVKKAEKKEDGDNKTASLSEA